MKNLSETGNQLLHKTVSVLKSSIHEKGVAGGCLRYFRANIMLEVEILSNPSDKFEASQNVTNSKLKWKELFYGKYNQLHFNVILNMNLITRENCPCHKRKDATALSYHKVDCQIYYSVKVAYSLVNLFGC